MASQDRFGYGSEEPKISKEEFKQSLKNELGILNIMKNPDKILNPKGKSMTFKVNPNRKNLQIINTYFAQNPKMATNMLKSDDEFWNKMRAHLYPKQESDRWGMSEEEWGNRNKGFFGRLFS